MPENQSRVRNWIPLINAFLVFVIAVVVLYGWKIRSVDLVQINPTFAPMQFNTALLFLISALGLIFVRFKQTGPAVALGGVVLFFAGLTLAQYIFGADFKIDELFVHPFTAVKTSNPGRMSPQSAVNFILIGFALFITFRKKALCERVRFILAVLVFTLSVSALLGYVFGIESAYGWGALTRMALHTSICFCFLAGGFFALNWGGDNRFAPAFIVFFAGLFISLFALQVMSNISENEVKSRFAGDSQDRTLAVQRQFEYTGRLLKSLRAFYEGSTYVDRNEFTAFSKRVLHETRSIQAVEWVQKVEGPARAEFEAELEQEGVKNVRIKELASQGGFTNVSYRPVYYVVTYTEPYSVNDVAMGFDHGSDPRRKAEIEFARDHDKPTATVPLHLFREPDPNSRGILVFEPVYNNEIENVSLDGRRNGFLGVLTAVIRFPNFVQRALSYVTPEPIDFYLFDVTDSTNPKLGYGSNPAYTQDKMEEIARGGFHLLTGIHLKREITFQDKQYLLVTAAGSDYIKKYKSSYPAVTFVLMLLLNVGATFFVAHAIGRNRDLEKLNDHLKSAQEAQAKWAAIVQSTNDAIIGKDLKGIITSWNRGAEKLYGYQAEEAVGRHVSIIAPPEKKSEIGILMEKIKNDEIVVEHQTIRQHKNGNMVYVSLNISPIHDLDGKIIGASVTARDVSELKAAMENIQSARRQLQAVLDSATEVSIIAGTPEGIITVFNKGAENMLGWKSEEMVGKKTPEIIHLKSEVERRGEELTKLFGKKISGFDVFVESARRGAPELREWTYVRKDGSHLTVSLVVSAIYDFQNKIVGFLGVAIDVTQRKKAEAELQRAMDAAMEASRAKSDFLATMSHEIRTPMNAILGMAELLSETELNDEQKQYVQTLSRGGETLLALINDVLDLSKIESGVIDLENADYSVKEITERVVEVLAIAAHRKGIELSAVIAQDIPDLVAGDPSRVRQILMNLIGNAIKFTEQGEVSVELKKEGSDLMFAIQDTGIGISPDKIEKLFNPFTQGDSSTTRKYGGTGLGLSICKKLTELMGGTIWVESEAGKGSRFCFKLPLRELTGEEIEADKKMTAAAPPVLQGKKVLIVDDNATNRLIINRAVTRWGMIPEEVSSGKDCLDILKSRAEAGFYFDLIILDCRMPDLGGFDVAKKLANEPKIKAPMIIMLTSDSRSGDMDTARKLGFEAYLVKPIRRSELLKVVTSVFVKNSAEPFASAPSLQKSEGITEVKKILLAEDAPDNQTLIKAYLKNQPYELDIADNGKIALEKAVDGQYDLILMDMQMPEMDGYTATQLIRSRAVRDRQGRRIQIVALTANTLKKDEEKCLAAGCDAYLSKPVKKTILLESIAAYFRSPAPGGEGI